MKQRLSMKKRTAKSERESREDRRSAMYCRYHLRSILEETYCSRKVFVQQSVHCVQSNCPGHAHFHPTSRGKNGGAALPCSSPDGGGERAMRVHQSDCTVQHSTQVRKEK